MSKRWIDFLCVICLTVIFPTTIISVVPGQETEQILVKEPTEETQTVTAEETGPTEETSEEICIAVLNSGKVEQMKLENYILCVVLAEMPASFELEALKAQAVVARTYTMRRQQGTPKHDQASVCTDPSCCQAYITPSAYLGRGGTVSEVDRVAKAVQLTKDMVLRYNGELIEATYFSCSGGLTEDASAVWGADIPYLKSTESPGEEGAKYFVDTVYFTSEEFESELECDFSGSPDTWFGAVTYTKGQGVDTIKIGGRVFKGTTIRQLLDLRSTAFTITAIGNTIVITTKGFGHRVGMSQYGADAMAVQGFDYRQILSHYYSGTSLTDLSVD